MQEVEAICNRVIIINKGEIVADDSAAHLARYREDARVTLYVEFDQTIEATKLTSITGVVSASPAGSNAWRLETDGSTDARRTVAGWAQEHNILIFTLREEEQKLEEVFKKLTAS
jgi:ABC-2 type transport system ATP-binding protein